MGVVNSEISYRRDSEESGGRGLRGFRDPPGKDGKMPTKASSDEVTAGVDDVKYVIRKGLEPTISNTARRITGNTGRITKNTSLIASNLSKINTNIGNITGNTNKATSNASAIVTNVRNIASNLSWMTNNTKGISSNSS